MFIEPLPERPDFRPVLRSERKRDACAVRREDQIAHIHAGQPEPLLRRRGPRWAHSFRSEPIKGCLGTGGVEGPQRQREQKTDRPLAGVADQSLMSDLIGTV